jgi:hypothetical protein
VAQLWSLGGMMFMRACKVLLGLIGTLVCLTGCVNQHSAQHQLAVSFVFCGYTNGGHSANLELIDYGRNLVEYRGPGVEVWNGTAWKDYSIDDADLAVRLASKNGVGSSEIMTVPVPPSPALWRAYINCIFYNHDLHGSLAIWTHDIQR